MKNLLPGEQEVRVARQHWVVFLPIVTVTLLSVAVVGLVVDVLPSEVGGRSLHGTKVLVLLAAVVVAAVTVTSRWLRWRFTTYTLTDRRVVVSRGVLSRYMESISLDRIQDISIRQGLMARMVRAGDVEIESAGRDGAEVLTLIGDPGGFGNDLQGALEAHRGGYGGGVMGGAPPQPGYGGPGYTPPGADASRSGYAPPPGYGPPPHGS